MFPFNFYNNIMCVEHTVFVALVLLIEKYILFCEINLNRYHWLLLCHKRILKHIPISHFDKIMNRQMPKVGYYDN